MYYGEFENRECQRKNKEPGTALFIFLKACLYSLHVRSSKTDYVLESTLAISDSRYWKPDSFSQGNLDSAFQRSGFPIPQAKIPAFRILQEKNSPHFGIRGRRLNHTPFGIFNKRNCSRFLWLSAINSRYVKRK